MTLGTNVGIGSPIHHTNHIQSTVLVHLWMWSFPSHTFHSDSLSSQLFELTGAAVLVANALKTWVETSATQLQCSRNFQIECPNECYSQVLTSKRLVSHSHTYHWKWGVLRLYSPPSMLHPQVIVLCDGLNGLQADQADKESGKRTLVLLDYTQLLPKKLIQA